MGCFQRNSQERKKTVYHEQHIRARRIGANPEKSDLINFRGPDERKFSELCFPIDKMFPESRFSKQIFGDPAGSTKLDRPHCKQF